MSEFSQQSASPHSAAEVRQEFSDLVSLWRSRALWFLADDAQPDLLQPGAEGVLRAILRAGDREAWIRARKLLAWRSQHCR
jgi:hypothetical protein